MIKLSAKRLEQLRLAREIGLSLKENCPFCHRSICRAGIKKHIERCRVNPLNLKHCKVCGTPVKRDESETCSHGCANKLFRTGPNHGNWKESAYRTTCFAYHKKECIVCGEAKIVDVHHRDRNKNNNSPLNLIPLCPTHHKYCHSKHKHLVEKIIREYIDKHTIQKAANDATNSLPKM